jgi:hypothetical protein
VPKTEVAGSFDHLVGAGEQRGRHGETKRFRRLGINEEFEHYLPAADVLRRQFDLYLDRSKVTILRVNPLSAQFGITRQGVNTTSRSPSSLKSRTCLVPTHSGFQVTSTLVVQLSPSTV